MTHDEKIVEAVARALCRRQIVSNLRWEKKLATPELIQRCEDVGWQSGEWIDQARAAITAFQAEAWQPKMVKLSAEDERLLDKALLASTDVIYPILPVDAGFEAIRDAYVRGATWSLEMGMHYKIEELHKAAYDYADKKSPPTPNPPASP